MWRAIAGITPGVITGYIAWEARRYWLALDELTRRLELEAAAYCYLLAMVACAVLSGLSFIFFRDPWVFFWSNPFWVSALIEPARGVILYLLARRY